MPNDLAVKVGPRAFFFLAFGPSYLLAFGKTCAQHQPTDLSFAITLLMTEWGEDWGDCSAHEAVVLGEGAHEGGQRGVALLGGQLR